jgi:hypothetical protein
MRRATLVNDSVVRLSFLEIDVTIGSVALITRLPEGSIEDAHVESYRSGAQEVQLKVTIHNDGWPEGPYVVTVTECGSSVDPVAAQCKTLSPDASAQLSFTLRTSGSFSSANTCRVRLKSVHGRVWDEHLVAFPEPAAP